MGDLPKSGSLCIAIYPGCPPWPCRYMAWPERDNAEFVWTDPAQDSIPPNIYPTTEDKDEHCIMFLGKIPPDFSTMSKKEVLPWAKYRDAFVKLNGSELLEGRFCTEFCRDKDFGYLFKDDDAKKKKKKKPQIKSPTNGNYSWKEFVTAVKEAVLLDEHAEDIKALQENRPNWFWDEYGKRYALTKVQMEVSPAKAKRPRPEKSSARRTKMEYDDIGEETETAYTSSGRQVKRLKILNQLGEYAPDNDDDFDMKEEVRAKREEKKKSVKTLLSGSKSAHKGTASAKAAAGNKTAGRSEREAEIKVRDFKEEMLHKDLKKQFESIKPIMGMDDMEKKAEYQAKFIVQCKEYMNPATRVLEEISGQIEGLDKQIVELQQRRERLKRKQEPILSRIKESVDGDLFQIIQKIWGSVEKYTGPVLVQSKLAKSMGKFKKENKAVLGTHKMGRVVAEIDNILSKWKVMFHQKPAQTGEANGGEVKGEAKNKKSSEANGSSTSREGNPKRQRVAQFLSMVFGKDNHNMMIGRDIEEDLFVRNGKAASEEYLDDVKQVHTKLKESESTYISDLHKGTLSISEFLNKIL